MIWSNPYRTTGARRAVETAIAQASTAVTRLPRPTVNSARTTRQATQAGRNSGSGTWSQNDHPQGARSASQDCADGRSAQPVGPRKACRSRPSTNRLQNSSAPTTTRMTPSAVGSAGVKKKSFQPRTVARPRSAT